MVIRVRVKTKTENFPCAFQGMNERDDKYSRLIERVGEENER
jgi:hypothetical protein